jgi:hypothetical protein
MNQEGETEAQIDPCHRRHRDVGSAVVRLRDSLGRGLSSQTVNKFLTTATAIFKLAVRRNYWTTNPAMRAERLRTTTAALVQDGSRPVRDASRPVRVEGVVAGLGRHMHSLRQSFGCALNHRRSAACRGPIPPRTLQPPDHPKGL